MDSRDPDHLTTLTRNEDIAPLQSDSSRYNDMHLALWSIVLKATNLEATMQNAGLSDSWTHRARSIRAVAQNAIGGLPEPVWPEGPPTPSITTNLK